MTPANKPDSGFFITVTCPGCGAGLNLESDFYSLTCRYCGSALRVIMPGKNPVYYIKSRKSKFDIRPAIDRYLKRNHLPLTRSDFVFRPIYYPYWKVNAIQTRASCGATQAHHKSSNFAHSEVSVGWSGTLSVNNASDYSPADYTCEDSLPKVKLMPFARTLPAGPVLPGIPLSLGLRTQYIQMEPLTSEASDGESEFITPQKDWSQVIADIRKATVHRAGINAGLGEKRRSDIFNPRGALIYFPYYIAFSDTASDTDVFILDGISGRVVYAGEGETDFIDNFRAEKNPKGGGALQVVLHRCRNCGLDLPADGSFVQICSNCGVVTVLDPQTRLEEGVNIAQASNRTGDPLFPFWKLKLPSEIIGQAVSPGLKESMPDYLIIPAFRGRNFEAIKRLAGRITNMAASLPQEKPDEISKGLYPVTVSYPEAVALAEILIFSNRIIRNRQMTADRESLSPEKAGLLYVPFHLQNYFFVDSVTGDITFEKSIVQESIIAID